jgi:hypothetical protein
MTLTSTQIAHLNKMNRAAQDVALGTLLNRVSTGSATNATAITALQTADAAFTSGSMTVGAVEANASKIVLYNPNWANAKSAIVQFYTTGSIVNNKAFYTSFASGSMTISGSECTVLANVARYIVYN